MSNFEERHVTEEQKTEQAHDSLEAEVKNDPKLVAKVANILIEEGVHRMMSLIKVAELADKIVGEVTKGEL